MIIDFHYHYFPHDIPDAAVRQNAEILAHIGSVMGFPRPASEVQAGLLSMVRDPDGEKLLTRMEKLGIDLTVVLGSDSMAPGFSDQDLLAMNKKCADLARKHPGKLAAFAGVDPRRRNAPYLFRKCLEDYGMRGIKLHPDIGQYWLNGEAAGAVLEVAQELGAVALTYCHPAHPPAKSKYSHPFVLDDVTSDFQKLKVVAAHCGQEWWYDWAAIAGYRPNLFGDLSRWQFLAMKHYEKFCRQLREMLDMAGPKIIFGTGAISFDHFIPSSAWIALIKDLPTRAPRGIEFTREEIDGILGGTAQKLLGL